MKKYLAARTRISAILMAGALGTFTFVAPQTIDAKSTPDKIRLMAETLRARDSGNLDTAKSKAEQLIKIAPNDENVQRLLSSINNELDRRSGGNAVYGKAPGVTAKAAMTAGSDATEAEAITAAVASAQDSKLEAAQNAIVQAGELAELGAYTDATNLLNAASASLTLNTATASTLDEIDEAKAQVVLEEAKAMAAAGDLKGAEKRVEDYRSAGGSSKQASALADDLDAEISNPYDLDINQVSPEYVAQSKAIRDLLTRGRAQYINGDYDGAAFTFKEVEARDANNAEAKQFQTMIAEILGGIHKQTFYKTRQQMLTEVDQSWERPKVFDVTGGPSVVDDLDNETTRKMNSIIIPQVNFSGMELTRVIETLSELSVEYDPERIGVNIVPLFNPNDANPRVNISLRNLNLDRVLQFVTQQVNFGYDVGADAVTVAPTGGPEGGQGTITEFFPISRATVIRLTGFRDGGSSSSGPVDPFAAPSAASSSGPSQNEEVEALQNFFQSAGVNFEIPGSSLAFDGEQLIVTQSRRNLERMRTILRNYSEVKQVEIEAKFLEVAQNDLDEVGFDWGVGDSAQPFLNALGAPVLDDFGNPTVAYERAGQTQGRSLNDSFGVAASQSNITINGEGVASNSAPDLSSAIDLASSATSLFTATGWSVNGYDVNFALRALSRKTGSDLMSAPKVTVLSGKRANITVAQELRYPESYGDIESTVSSSNSGGAAISITAGTPQDFVTRNVGVEMSVTPNVENDDTISLILEPRVTEFEGFVEYGGPSVAVVGGSGGIFDGVASEPTTVTVPAGFYQPVFSTRELSTEVTVFDGATVVMGGLTRDEVKSVTDKVPVLGDIPGLGRLFRSEGESRQKRNLLIFVTANLVSPGGSPSRQQYRNVTPNSLFQNPTIMTPSGAVNRSIESAAE
ncbi:MAG: type II secretory pathway, component PulD [Opitutaceae bacterium]